MVLSVMKRITLAFYESLTGKLPVRDWLLQLSEEDRKLVGIDLATVEYGWPIGMPICKSLGSGLWEVRTDLSDKKIVMLLFCTHNNRLWSLHGFVKKSQKTPKADMDRARKRMKEIVK